LATDGAYMQVRAAILIERQSKRHLVIALEDTRIKKFDNQLADCTVGSIFDDKIVTKRNSDSKLRFVVRFEPSTILAKTSRDGTEAWPFAALPKWKKKGHLFTGCSSARWLGSVVIIVDRTLTTSLVASFRYRKYLIVTGRALSVIS